MSLLKAISLIMATEIHPKLKNDLQDIMRYTLPLYFYPVQIL